MKISQPLARSCTGFGGRVWRAVGKEERVLVTLGCSGPSTTGEGMPLGTSPSPHVSDPDSGAATTVWTGLAAFPRCAAG